MRINMPHIEGMNLARLTSVTLASLLSLAALSGCAATSHPVGPAALGTPSRARSLESLIDEPGPVVVDTVVGADWEVPLSGLLNLDAPAAKAAGLVDRAEPIQIYFHAVRHPTRGTYLVDTGVERAIFEAPTDAAIGDFVASFMNLERMTRRTDTATWIAAHRAQGPIAGVFLTHLHLDHVSGMRDVPDAATVFVGPGEADEHAFVNLFTRPTADRALEDKPRLAAWQFAPDPDGRFEGVLDVFGDGTVFALHVPGHTAGSTAHVVRTPKGPVLLTGDACHTAWGWEHGVEPGTFSVDRPKSRESLERLRDLARRHPKLDVRLGHQTLVRAR